jgi:hypothetical protein
VVCECPNDLLLPPLLRDCVENLHVGCENENNQVQVSILPPGMSPESRWENDLLTSEKSASSSGTPIAYCVRRNDATLPPVYAVDTRNHVTLTCGFASFQHFERETDT